MVLRFRSLLVAGWLVATTGGCQSDSEQEPAKAPDAAPVSESTSRDSFTLREVSAESLDLETVLNEPIPIEPGKLELASPVDWGMAPRSSNYIARFYFYKNRRTRLPRIWITAAVTPESGIQDP